MTTRAISRRSEVRMRTHVRYISTFLKDRYRKIALISSPIHNFQLMDLFGYLTWFMKAKKLSRSRDVFPYLINQFLFAVEFLLFSQPVKKLYGEFLPQYILVETQQMCLYGKGFFSEGRIIPNVAYPIITAVRNIHNNGIDALPGDQFIKRPEVGGRDP